MSNTQDSFRISLSPTEIILSCTICQDTLSTIYAEDDERGLHKSDDHGNGRITRLWLTECAHLTCAKHLEGGGDSRFPSLASTKVELTGILAGVPFHSDQQVPRAPCPLCSIEKGDRSDKSLFFINGSMKGEYDSNIPDAYFQMPPVKFISGDAGYEALRFQYLSLIRFSSKTHDKAVRSSNALQRWENKKAEIVRSLSTVAPLRNELLRAGRKLLSLGQDVSSIEVLLHSVGVSLRQHLECQQRPETWAGSGFSEGKLSPLHRLDVGSRLAQGSAADLDNLSQKTGIFHGQKRSFQSDLTSQDSSSMKRTRVESGSGVEQQQMDYLLGGRRYQKGQSTDLMPPPPIPMQQLFVSTAGESLLTTQFNSSRGVTLAAPIDSLNNCHGPLPDAFRVEATPRILTVGGPRSDSAWPPRVQAAFDGQDEGSQRSYASSLLSRRSTGSGTRGRVQGHDQGSSQLDMEVYGRRTSRAASTNRTARGIGISGNTRSSSYQQSRSTPNSGSHRERLGGPSASPHFSRRQLSSTLAVPPLGDRPSTNSYPLNSYDSNTTTLVGSMRPPGQREASIYVAQEEDHVEFDRSRAAVAGPANLANPQPDPLRGRIPTAAFEASTHHRPDASRGRMPTADPAVWALRRRANR